MSDCICALTVEADTGESGCPRREFTNRVTADCPAFVAHRRAHRNTVASEVIELVTGDDVVPWDHR